MAKALSLFHPLVLPHALGCSNPLLDQAILQAAGEFCRETTLVQEVSPQNVVAYQADYDVDVPTGQQLSCVLQVFHGDSELDPAGVMDVHRGTAVRGSVGQYTVSSGTPTVFYQKIPTDPVVSLYPVPDASLASGLAIRAAFEPTPSATTLADVLYDQFADDIANGAIAYLLELPGQVFSNPVLARVFRQRFDAAVASARTTAASGRVRRSRRVQPRRFA